MDVKKTEQLKKSLEAGIPMDVALQKIGEKRSSYIINALDEIKVRSNTVGGCPIGLQYCGCEKYK
jgi:hypothetical protein